MEGRRGEEEERTFVASPTNFKTVFHGVDVQKVHDGVHDTVVSRSSEAEWEFPTITKETYI